MSATIANGKIPDLQTEAREITRRQMQEWFDWIDHILDVHRSNFVFRQATAAELEEHKRALRLSIRTCLLINALIGDPEFNERDLASLLKVRIQQLQDAHDTFHDSALSDAEAEKILKQVFPE